MVRADALDCRPVGRNPGSARRFAAGAVGDISLRFFDEHGAPVRTSLDDRVLGITTAQLRKVPRVVAIAGGLDKVDAIAAALGAGIVNVLLTDQSTAQALVDREIKE